MIWAGRFNCFRTKPQGYKYSTRYSKTCTTFDSKLEHIAACIFSAVLAAAVEISSAERPKVSIHRQHKRQ
jgi:hypothetical protein